MIQKATYWWAWCWVVLPACLHAQGFRISSQMKGDSVVYYVSNDNYCPYYIELHPRVDTVEFAPVHIFVAEPQTKDKRVIAYRKPVQVGKISHSASAYLGNPAQKPDSSYVYSLPYAPMTRHKIMQGYNGRFSHQNQHALDFKMKEGTPIHATRGGVVVKVKQDSDKHGRTSAFAEHGNYIIIYHEDGTFAYYYHIPQNGSKVNVGEQVKQGQIIALSGNTGWTTSPHLHFVVKRTTEKGYKTIPTLFCADGKTKKKLRAWQSYKACK